MTSPQSILEELKGVFEEKNEDYGNSWEKVGVIKRVMADEDGPNTITLSESQIHGHVVTGPNQGDKYVAVRVPEDFFDGRDEVEFVELAETPRTPTTFQQNVDDLVTRLLDKLVRAYNTTLMKEEPALDNESTLDAWKDLTGYSSMGTSLVARQTDGE
jgi:hypothetical protein